MWIDISAAVNEETAVYPGDPVFKAVKLSETDTDGFCMHRLTVGTHCGTHIDAPRHFIKRGRTVDAIGPEAVNGLCRVLMFNETGDITKKFVEENHIMPGERILFKTWASLGSEKNIRENYPGISKEAAELLALIKPACIGIDTMSIEPQGGDGDVHRRILGEDIPVIETLDLKSVVPGVYRLHCLPLKLSGLDGSPVRAMLECV